MYVDKDRNQETTEGAGNDGGSEVGPGDLYGEDSGTEGDGEELERGSEVNSGEFEGDSLGIRRSLSEGEVIEENTQMSVTGMQSEIQEAIEGDLTTPMGAEVNQGNFITMKQYFIPDRQFLML